MARVHPEIYFFGAGAAEGRATMRELLGGKGAGLHEMASLKLPVPPGFTITTRVCTYFYERGGKYPAGLKEGVAKSVARLEKAMGRRFGDAHSPLLVSVRSGARVSMPGMMDTVLNLGLTDETVKGLESASQNPRFAWDSYRRFCQMYGDVVLKLKPENKNDPDPFEELIDRKKALRGVVQDVDLTAEDLKELVGEFRELIRARTGQDVPQDPWAQLWAAIGAVFESWNNDRAVTYRKLNNIPGDWGTAVTVQSMVFGNLGADCATGVAFTRDPSTGAKGIYGEFLPNAQGEDVVAGIRTPRQISLRAGREWADRSGVSEEERGARHATLEEGFPSAYRDLLKVASRLERHFRDMQDLEFTIERGKLYMLQTRTGKRTAEAAVRAAVEMTQERLIDRGTALLRVEPVQLEQLLHPRLDPRAPKKVLARGLPASPGAVAGEVVFSADEAVAVSKAGRKVILVRVETSPEDIHGMQVAEGILTARGGMTSHAAVVARGMGKCCVAGCSEIEINYAAGTLSAAGQVMHRGEYLTLDGTAGEVIEGRVPTVEPVMSPFFKKFLTWADAERRLGVRANADTPHDAKAARDFGAEGIGLCRTEHMFFAPERIEAVREMILAETGEQRARENPADAARGFHRPPARDEGAACDHPPARSPAARIPAQGRSRDSRSCRQDRRHRGPSPAGPRQPVRVQSDAGTSRLAPGHQLSRDLQGAGARDPRGRPAAARRRRARDPRNHAAAHRRASRIRRAGRRNSRGRPRARNAGQVFDRHDDRSAARLYRGRRDRRGG